MAPRLILVLARARNGVIGNKGDLPWHLPEDLKRFKQLTMGKPILMGRKTWDSLPKKPLPGRTNIVLTRDRSFAADGAVVVHSLDDAIAAGREVDEIMVIGGADIYAATLSRAARIYLTEVDVSPEGDTHFPSLSCNWVETARETHPSETGLRFSYVTLDRV